MSDTPPPRRRGLLSSLGPAIITASVVLGPGSILSASKIGWQYEYQMTWVLGVAVLLMVGMTALSARLGVMLDRTMCEEIADRAGRPLAAVTGLAVFLICACFQFSNNLGVLAAVEPFYSGDEAVDKAVPIAIIVGLNLLVMIALFGFRALYKPIEKLMKFLVGLMMLGFASNLLLAKPNLLDTLLGFIPSVPEGTFDALIPRWQEPVVENGAVVAEGKVIDTLVPVTALFATTFSVAGAFYQSYLVRQKGWTRADLRQGFVDTAVGISMLGLITLMILVTAAAVLYDNPSVTKLNSTADVARQLEPAFGKMAMVLFCLGIFAGAFSSFLVNAMIGGSMLSDGLGLGGYIDQRWPKIYTAAALMIGMAVAVYTQYTEQRPVNLIIFAQSLTVLGLPILAAVMVWLSMQPDLKGERQIPAWMKWTGGIAFVITLFLAIRSGTAIVLNLMHG